MDIMNRFFQTACGDMLTEINDRLDEAYVHFDATETKYSRFMAAVEALPPELQDEFRDLMLDLNNAYEYQGFANGFKIGITMIRELSGMKAA